MIILRQRLGIIEITSNRICLLIGPKIKKAFNIRDFKLFSQKTKLKENMHGGKIDPLVFRSLVLGPLFEYLEMAKKENVEISLCFATEWAREITNIKELLKLIPIPVKILSGQEEAELTLTSYLASCNRDLKEYSTVASLDCGSLSTEICVLGGEKLSVKNTEIEKLKGSFGYLKKEKNALIAISVNLWNPKTGNGESMKHHDTIFPQEAINRDKELKRVFKIIGTHHTIVINGTEAIFGAYFKYFG